MQHLFDKNALHESNFYFSKGSIIFNIDVKKCFLGFLLLKNALLNKLLISWTLF